MKPDHLTRPSRGNTPLSSPDVIKPGSIRPWKCGTLQRSSPISLLLRCRHSAVAHPRPHLVTPTSLPSPRYFVASPLTSSLSVSHGHGLTSSLFQSLTSSSSSRSRNPALRSLRWRQKAHRRQKSSSISASAPSGQSGGGGRLLGRGLGTSYPGMDANQNEENVDQALNLSYEEVDADFELTLGLNLMIVLSFTCS
ncbi:uncharacterized protein DS421_14g457240 [Arachis hypogaea]|nr:uncharacterized protein DS421_14g457240 [Arachis hypogaea]